MHLTALNAALWQYLKNINDSNKKPSDLLSDGVCEDCNFDRV